MIKQKKTALFIVVAILLFLVISYCHYLANNLNVAEKSKTKITASNGVKFKVVYTLYNFPSESYGIEIYEKRGDKIRIFSGNGRGGSDIQIEYLCSDGDYDYYKAICENYGKVCEELFVCNDEAFDYYGGQTHIAQNYESTLSFNEIDELFIPAAKYEIMNDNNGDYVGAYAEHLISFGDKELLQKLRFFVESPDEIKCEIHTKEEILAKCNELLQKYGDVQ